MVTSSANDINTFAQQENHAQLHGKLMLAMMSRVLSTVLTTRQALANFLKARFKRFLNKIKDYALLTETDDVLQL